MPGGVGVGDSSWPLPLGIPGTTEKGGKRTWEKQDKFPSEGLLVPRGDGRNGSNRGWGQEVPKETSV